MAKTETPEGFEDTWSAQERAAHDRALGDDDAGDTPIPPGHRSKPDLYPQRAANDKPGEKPIDVYSGTKAVKPANKG